MLKVFLFISGLVLVGPLMAQKTAVVDAILAHKENDYATAKEKIDGAVVDPKTSLDAKTWFYKGLIYGDIASSTSGATKSLAKNALKESAEALQKSVNLDKPNGEWASKSKDKMNALWGTAINEGAELYNAQKFSEAVERFQVAQILKPMDTTAYIYSSACAEQSQRYDIAKKDYENLFKIGYKSVDTYRYYIRILSEIDKNDAKTIEALAQARAAFPNDKELLKFELKKYIDMGKTSEVIAKMEEAAVKDPANAKLYYYNLGSTYAGMKDLEKAKTYYKKSLEADPNYIDANFNMGVLYWDEARVFYKKANDMDFATYQKSGKAVEDKGNALAKLALPYFEKAYDQSKANNVSAQEVSNLKLVLRDIYRNLKMADKMKSIMD